MLNIHAFQAQSQLSAEMSLSGQPKQTHALNQQADQHRSSIGRMLANAVLNRVGAALEARGIEFKVRAHPQANPATADKSEATLIKQIQAPLQQAATAQDLETSTQAVKEGIGLGIQDTKRQLQNSNGLHPAQAQQIERTEQSLLKGVDAVRTRMQQEQVSDLSSSLIHTVERSRNLSLHLETNEGDAVEIEIDIDHFTQRTTALAANQDEFTYSKQTERSVNAAVSFSVQGDLNSDEQQALDNFLGKVQTFSEGFFSKRMAQAMEQGIEGLMDAGHEFASFSLELNQSVSRQTQFNYASTSDLNPNVPGSLKSPIEAQPGAQALIAEATAPGPNLQRFTNLSEVLSQTFTELSAKIDSAITNPNLAPTSPIADPVPTDQVQIDDLLQSPTQAA